MNLFAFLMAMYKDSLTFQRLQAIAPAQMACGVSDQLLWGSSGLGSLCTKGRKCNIDLIAIPHFTRKHIKSIILVKMLDISSSLSLS